MDMGCVVYEVGTKVLYMM